MADEKTGFDSVQAIGRTIEPPQWVKEGSWCGSMEQYDEIYARSVNDPVSLGEPCRASVFDGVPDSSWMTLSAAPRIDAAVSRAVSAVHPTLMQGAARVMRTMWHGLMSEADR